MKKKDGSYKEDEQGGAIPGGTLPFNIIPDMDALQPSTMPISLARMGEIVYPPLEWVIEDLIPLHGLTMLAADPKAGKTRLVTNLALSIARGEKALGKLDCEKRDVLCIFAEDNDRSIDARVRQLLLPETPRPENLVVKDYQWPSGKAGLGKIDRYLAENPATKVVFIDVWDHVRPPTVKRGVYRDDRAALQMVRDIVMPHEAMAFLVHHTNKADRAKGFDRISGSQGLFGSVDVGWLLEREFDSDQATLSIQGREVEEKNLTLEYDADSGRWTLLGNSAFYIMSESRRKLFGYIVAKPGKKAGEIAKALELNPSTTRTNLANMVYDGILRKEDKRYWARVDDEVLAKL